MTDFRFEVIRDDAHRPWPVPDQPWLMRQTWSDLLFAHWPIPPERLRARLPRGLTLDLYNGDAWISVVPFTMSNVGIREWPNVPHLSRFPELNVRTYVRRDNKPGVYFFSLDAARLAAVVTARVAFGLPYFWAFMSSRRDGRRVVFESRRSSGHPSLQVSYQPTSRAFIPAADSLEFFLTERYCLYSTWAARLLRLEIQHPPWQLHQATASWRLNTMLAPLGLTVREEPVLQYVERQDVVAWGPEWC